MELLVILCMVATLLTGNAFALRFGGDYIDSLDPKVSIKPRCAPFSCVVFNNTLCRCSLSGDPICGLSHFPDDNSFFCACKPREVIPSHVPCVCPKKGLVVVGDCRDSILPADDLRSDVKNIQGEYDRQSMLHARTDCNYWYCQSHGKYGDVCVWIPCRTPQLQVRKIQNGGGSEDLHLTTTDKTIAQHGGFLI